MNYIKRKSAKQEKRTASEFGGSVTPASGAMWGAKGDVRTDSFLIENKYTDANSYKLDTRILDKISKEALKDNFRMPVLQIDIQELQLVVLDLNDFIATFEDTTIYTTEVTTNKTITLNKDDLYLIAGESPSLRHGIKFYGIGEYVILFKSDFLEVLK